MKTLLFLVFSLLLLNVMALDEFQMKANRLFSEYNPTKELVTEKDVNPTESWDNYYREQNGRDPLMVSTMPSNDVNIAYGNALINQPIAIWGSARGGTSPYDWKIYINNVLADSGSTANGRYIGIDYTFPYTGLKTIRMEVTDADTTFASHESVVRVHPSLNQTNKVNMSIEKGLLYLYNQAVVYNTNYIYWGNSNSDGGTGATGLGCLAFEENGHIPDNNFQDDIYAETVRMGLNHLLTQSANTYSGHAYLRNNQYANGIAWLAVIMAHADATAAQNDIIEVGPFTGMSFYELVQSGIALYELNQGNSGEWHYTVATDNSSGYDGSCQQWPVFMMKAAEDRWGISAPETTQNMAMTAYTAMTNANGACGYGSSNQYLNAAKTGGMLVAYVWADKLQEQGDQNAINSINFIGTKWYQLGHQTSYPGWVADFYSMYGVKKGLELQNTETISTPNGERFWYDDMVDWLLGHDTDFTLTFSSTYRTTGYAFGQKASGGWQSAFGYVNSHGPSGDHLDTAHAILVLTKAVTTIAPVAVIDPVNDQPQNTSFQVSGQNSYHPDPTRTIVQWLWDWNIADGVDWTNPDATGQQPTNPGYPAVGAYTMMLRVMDDNDPPRYDTVTIPVNITSDNHPPVAVAIPDSLLPSYAGFVGQPITLDGSQSYDPDPEDYITEWSWDTDGNGVFGDAFGETTDVNFPGEYIGSIGLQVTSSDGTSATSSAYVDIAFSGSDIYVEEFHIYRLLEGMTDLHLQATITNDVISNEDAENILIQFYDGNPFTTGQRIGGNYYLDLAIGQSDVLDINLTISEGLQQLYIFLDANENVIEWDELNNVLMKPILYGFGEDDFVSMNEDEITEFNLLTNDFLTEGEVSIASVTQPQFGTVEILDELAGTIQYSPTQPNYNGQDSLAYYILTPLGIDSTAYHVSITINPVNDAPVCDVLPIIDGDIFIGSTISSTPTEWNDNIDDSTNVVTPTLQWQSAENEAFTTNVINLSDAHSDTYTITQNEKNKYLRLQVTGTDNGTPLPGASTIVYSNILFVQNNLPEIAEGELFQETTLEDSTLTFSLQVIDVDNDEDFTWELLTEPSFGEILVGFRSRNEQTMNFIYQPNADVNGVDSFIIGVSDGTDVDTILLEITITPVNDAPVITFPENFVYQEDDAATYNFPNYITDIDNSYEELILSWSGNQQIQVENNNWQITFSSNSLDWFGQEEITFTVEDGSDIAQRRFHQDKKANKISKNRSLVEATVLVICEPVADAPEIILPDSFAFNEDENTVVDFEPYVSDVDSEELYLSYQPTETIIIDIDEFQVTLSAPENWFGSEVVTFMVQDEFGRLYDTDDVEIIVTPVNDEPILVSFLPEEQEFVVQQNASINFSINVEDIDNETLNYNWFVNDENQDVNANEFTCLFPIPGEFAVIAEASDGEYSVETLWQVTVEEVSSENDVLEPNETTLLQNVPNPFNPETKIRFFLKEVDFVELKIYNIKGILVQRLVHENLSRGFHDVIWHGDDFRGNSVSSGIYFYSLRTKNYNRIRKMILMK